MMYQRLQTESEDEHEWRMLLLGKTGSGKSSTGNIIFKDQVFLSEISSSSVTRVCQPHTGVVNNRRVTAVDTPDFRFSTHTDFDSHSELKKALQLCSPGAHVILLLLPLITFTEQEMEFIDWFEQTFGSEALRFTLVLFTHADQKQHRPLREMIRRNNTLSDFINRCGQRYHEFDIKDLADRRQVTELMEKIDRLLSENRNSLYTLEMMEENEKRRKEEERRAEEERRREEERRTEEEMRERKREEEMREREHQMTLERVRMETEINVRREYEEKERAKMIENKDKAGKKEKPFVFQFRLKYFCVIMSFAVATGVVLVWKKEKGSSHGWMFMCGFITGGSAAATGVFTGILWRLMLKSQFARIFPSNESPSAVRQFLLKGAGVGCGLFAGAVIGYYVGGNIRPITVLAGLAGAAGVVTSIKLSC